MKTEEVKKFQAAEKGQISTLLLALLAIQKFGAPFGVMEVNASCSPHQ